MSLISCPSCRKKVSDKNKICPECGASLFLSVEEIERIKVLNYRAYRDKMYRLKMLTFLAVAVALIGIVPMVWDYARALDYGFNAIIINHWGIYFAIAGFLMYVFCRILMMNAKRQYKQNL